MVNLRTQTGGTVTPDANYSTPGSPLFQRGPRFYPGPFARQASGAVQQRLARRRWAMS
jgi:hypothetical protein